MIRRMNASDAGGSGLVAGERGRHGVDARILGDDGAEALDGGDVARVVDLHGEQERTVEAGSEAFGDQVVGLAGGGLLAEVALVGEPEPQVQHGRRHQEQEATGDGDAGPGAGLHDAAPPVRPGLTDRAFLAWRHLSVERLDDETRQQRRHHQQATDRPEDRDAEPEPEQGHGGEPGCDQTSPPGHLDPAVGERQQSRQQRDRGEQREEHGGGGGDTEPGHELESDQQHAQQRQHDRDAGEHDGASGGVHRSDRGLFGGGAGACELAVSGHDEQGVVDADAEPDHDADQWCELGDREQVGQQGDQAEPSCADPGDGDADRQSHRQHRSEGEDQHDDRERQTDQLGLGWLELGERRTADLDPQTVDSRATSPRSRHRSPRTRFRRCRWRG